MDAGAVAGLAVRVDRAAMPDRAKRFDALLDDIAPRLAVDRRDEPDSARIVLHRGIVSMRRFKLRAVLEVTCHFIGHSVVPGQAVVSAKAGTQFVPSADSHWVPAFAGTTAEDYSAAASTRLSAFSFK